MRPVQIGIIGLGTVGAGTVNVLARNGDEIARRAGREVHIALAAVRQVDKPRDCDTQKFQLVTDPMAISNHPDIDVVIELIGGHEPARTVVLRAIENGKQVVTANKALIAEYGNEIFAAAEQRGVTVAFEAAVAGGISIIKAIREGLAGNRIESMAGIINGTANYILTAMREEQCTFADKLAQAQRLGYAEADPKFDVEGVDAAHKLTILAAIAFGIPLQFAKVYTEGISQISLDDITYAEELGFRIKHLGVTKRTPTGIELRVHPCLLLRRHLLAHVEGVMNAIYVKGDAAGPTLHYGAGAGAEPTASAVVADIVDVVRTLTIDPGNRVPHLAFQRSSITDVPIQPMSAVTSAYYLRMHAINRPGVLADVTKILGDLNISIEAILQKGSGEHESVLPVILLTQQTLESRMNEALERLAALPTIEGEISRIRVEQLE
ncbi:MAG: homoserine dehydrogenase, partial [Gammaproteobacteria bacterium]|nr:homoserine dehydrogenase [Gammaproteobacteria bacterium]